MRLKFRSGGKLKLNTLKLNFLQKSSMSVVCTLLFSVLTTRVFSDNVNRSTIENDTWVLYNMFHEITELRQAGNDWFNFNDFPSPCDWHYVECDENSRVTYLGNFQSVGLNGNGSINTTFWPTKLETIKMNVVYFDGTIRLDNLPKNSIQYIDITDSPNIIIDTFPNLVNFSELVYLSIQHVSITDPDSFVNSVLSPKLRNLDLSGTDYNGYLNFETLMPHSAELENITLDSIKIELVNFWGLNDDTNVVLTEDSVCTIDSYFTSRDNYDWNSNASTMIENLDRALCIPRKATHCTGTQECLNTCECFIISTEWQPALNDFYTYVV